MAKLAVILTCHGKVVGRVVIDAEPRLSFPERAGKAFAQILLGEPDISLIDCEIAFERILDPAEAYEARA